MVAAEFFSGWAALFATSRSITTNQGWQIEAALFTSVAKLLGAERIPITPCHTDLNYMMEG